VTRFVGSDHRRSVAFRIGLLLAVPGIAPACGESGHLLGRAGGIGDGSAGGQGGTTDAGDAAPVACSGLGPSVTLPSLVGSACTSALTTRHHRFALCLCDSLNATAPIYTDSFDSSGAVIGPQPPAAIGIDGDLQTSTVIQALGSVYVTGPGGVMSADRLVSLGSLRVSGPTRSPSGGVVDIGEDVYAGGDLEGFVILGGTLHLAPGASTAAATIYAGDIVREPVSIAAPCDCGQNAVGVAAGVAMAMRVNDNASVGLAADRLAAVTTSTVLDIPCGTYALSSIDTRDALVLAVHGRALVAVAGDVVLRAGFSVTLDPGAELDLLVGGRLLTSGSNMIGSMTPARFRIWVAGSQTVVFDDDPSVGAVIHAPGAPVTASAGLELSGALFAKTITAGARVNVHFDQAVFSVGASCGEPTATAVP
jgi:hypothetical protein